MQEKTQIQPATDNFPRKNYIRRKKCLNESIALIEKTLFCISKIRKDQADKNELTKLARAHANEVEAACWAPRMKMSDDDYQNLMETKTKELCLVLIKKLLPTIDTSRVILQNHSPASSPPTPQHLIPSKKEIKPVPVIAVQQQAKKPTMPIVQPQIKPVIPQQKQQQNPQKQQTIHQIRTIPQSPIKQAKFIPPNNNKPIPVVSKPKAKLPTVQINHPNITPLDPWADFSIPLQDPNENYCFSPSFVDQNMPDDLLGEYGIDELSMALESGPKIADDSFLPSLSFPDVNLP